MYWKIRKTSVDVRSLEALRLTVGTAKRREENGWKAKGEWQKAAISSSLVLREHIYFTLISNALVSFLSLCIVETCDLILTACRSERKKEGFQNGHFTESISQLLQPHVRGSTLIAECISLLFSRQLLHKSVRMCPERRESAYSKGTM